MDRGIMGSLVKRQYQGMEIRQRKSDRYFDATQMCQAAGKYWGTYWQNQNTKEYVDALSLNIGIPHNKLVQSRKGRTGGTFVHPQLAIHLAQWLSPQIAVVVSQWALERIEEESNPDLAIERGIKRATDYYRRQGKSEEWIKERLNGKQVRCTFTSDLADHGVVKWGFGNCTNAIYKHILGGDANTIKASRELSKQDNLRDHLARREISFVRFAEELASMRLDHDKSMGNKQCEETCDKAGKLTKDAISQMMKGSGK